MTRKSIIEAPTPKNITDIQENGFHLMPISKRDCNKCKTIRMCDLLMQSDGIVVLPGGATCDVVRARGPKHDYKK